MVAKRKVRRNGADGKRSGAKARKLEEAAGRDEADDAEWSDDGGKEEGGPGSEKDGSHNCTNGTDGTDEEEEDDDAEMEAMMSKFLKEKTRKQMERAKKQCTVVAAQVKAKAKAAIAEAESAPELRKTVDALKKAKRQAAKEAAVGRAADGEVREKLARLNHDIADELEGLALAHDEFRAFKARYSALQADVAGSTKSTAGEESATNFMSLAARFFSSALVDRISRVFS